MVSQLTVIDAAFLSRSRGVRGGGGVTRKIHEEREERAKEKNKKNKWRNRCLAIFTDPLSAKETQRQIAALHRQIYP